MPRITAAKFQKLLPDAVEMETVTGELVHLDRTDIDAPTAVNGGDDKSVTAWFEKNPEVLVIYTRVDPQSKYLAAKRFSLLSTPVLMRVASYRIGEAYEMRINDTNARLYAHGELADGLEGRCEKHSIRKMLKDRGVLPLRQPEGHSKVGAAELAAASLEDDQFWQLYYPEYELNPGDTVVGLVTGFEFGDDPDSLVVLLDVPGYIQRLKPGSKDVFERLGLKADVLATAVEASHPVVQQPQVESRPAVPCSSILVLDDDIQGDLKLMAGFLRSMGLDVTACSSRTEADAAVTRHLGKHGDNFFHLALIDVNLNAKAPQADYEGIRFARELQRRMPECAITLISGAKDRPSEREVREAAGDLLIVDFLPKPFTMEGFRRWIREVPKTRRLRAYDLLAGDQASASEIERRASQARQLALDNIASILRRLRGELHADKVTVFRMHKVSRAVSIVADLGEPFPRFRMLAKRLRYSPIRDVCEDKEEWCHNNVPEDRAQKHRNLLSICDPEHLYTSCLACPVPEPPGDDHWYGLFAFVLPDPQRPDKPTTFDVAGKILDHVPEAASEGVRGLLARHLAREHAAYVAQHLLERWHEATQILQYPFLMTGLATSSVGHDLANSLMGADQAIGRLHGEIREGAAASRRSVAEVALLRDKTTRAIAIATSFKKLARAQHESPSGVRLREVVLSVCEAVTFEAERNRVSLHVHGDPNTLLVCRRGAVERILFNLVLNAVQQIGRSLRGSGQVHVVYRYQKGKKGLEAVLHVYDNGPGIQGYRYFSIFNPGETTRPEGSGLGLAIAKEESARLKGAVRLVKSILYCGTCFELALPNETSESTTDPGEES